MKNKRYSILFQGVGRQIGSGPSSDRDRRPEERVRQVEGRDRAVERRAGASRAEGRFQLRCASAALHDESRGDSGEAGRGEASGPSARAGGAPSPGSDRELRHDHVVVARARWPVYIYIYNLYNII